MSGVIVLGALGRMGSLLCATIAAQDDLTLVARVDPGRPASDERGGDRRPSPAVGAAVCYGRRGAGGRAARRGRRLHRARRGVRQRRRRARGRPADGRRHDGPRATTRSRACRPWPAPTAPLLVVPNFALGAVLLMQFAARGGPLLPGGRDHRSPRAGQGRRAFGHLAAHGAAHDRGGAAHPHGAAEARPSRGLASGGVRIHSVRLPGFVAHQEVVFGGVGETLSIRHDSLSRESFMAGVLLAIRRVPSLEGTTIGLENLLLDTVAGQQVEG